MSKSRSHVVIFKTFNIAKDVIAMLEEGTLSSGQARPIGLINASSIAEEIVSKIIVPKLNIC